MHVCTAYRIGAAAEMDGKYEKEKKTTEINEISISPDRVDSRENENPYCVAHEAGVEVQKAG